MSVLHPTLLAAGLAAVALPILIHLLLRRRYTPVRWAAMRFVLVAQKQQRRRRRLEQILLLIARCLVVAMIALAVSAPLLGGPSRDRERTLVLILDNALASRAANEEGGTDFEDLRSRALAELDTLRPVMGDRVAVITMASPASAPIATPTTDLDAARRIIESLEPTDAGPDLAGALALAGNASADGDASALLLSAWRAGSVEALRTAASRDAARMPAEIAGGSDLPSGAFDLRLASPVERDAPNLRITDIALPRAVILATDTPSVRQALVTIDRTGPADRETRGQLSASVHRTVGSGTAASTTLPFVIPSGARETTVAIELPETREGAAPPPHGSAVAEFRIETESGRASAPDAIPSDSTRLVAIRVAEGISAGVIRSRGIGGVGIPAEAWVAAALRPNETAPIRLREIPHAGLDATSLIGLDIAVLARPDLLAPPGWDAVADFVGAGGALLVFAAPSDGAQNWVDDASARIPSLASLGREHDEFTGETLVPGADASAIGLLGAELAQLASAVRVTRALPFATTPASVILATESGAPVVARPAPRVWCVATAIDPAWSDIAARPLFLPLMQEIARQSQTRGVSLTATAGRPFELPPLVERLTDRNEADTSPDATSTASSSATESSRGFRTAGTREALGAGNEPVGLVAINADTPAGDTATTTRAQVEAALTDTLPDGFTWADADADAADATTDADKGPNLGLLAFLAAAVLAVVESLIALSAARKPMLGVRTNASPAAKAPRAARAVSPRGDAA